MKTVPDQLTNKDIQQLIRMRLKGTQWADRDEFIKCVEWADLVLINYWILQVVLEGYLAITGFEHGEPIFKGVEA